MALGLKDIRLALAAADTLAAPMPVASLVHDHFLAGVAQAQAIPTGRGWRASPPRTRVSERTLRIGLGSSARQTCRNRKLGQVFLWLAVIRGAGREASLAGDLAAIRGKRDGPVQAYCNRGSRMRRGRFAGFGRRSKTGARKTKIRRLQAFTPRLN